MSLNDLRSLVEGDVKFVDLPSYGRSLVPASYGEAAFLLGIQVPYSRDLEGHTNQYLVTGVGPTPEIVAARCAILVYDLPQVSGSGLGFRDRVQMKNIGFLARYFKEHPSRMEKFDVADETYFPSPTILRVPGQTLAFHGLRSIIDRS